MCCWKRYYLIIHVAAVVWVLHAVGGGERENYMPICGTDWLDYIWEFLGKHLYASPVCIRLNSTGTVLQVVVIF